MISLTLAEGTLLKSTEIIPTKSVPLMVIKVPGTPETGLTLVIPGDLDTSIRLSDSEVQPLPSVIVTLYVEVQDGETVMDVPVELSDHEQATEPVTVIVADDPAQIMPSLLTPDEVSVTDTTGEDNEFTVITDSQVAVLPIASDTVSVTMLTPRFEQVNTVSSGRKDTGGLVISYDPSSRTEAGTVTEPLTSITNVF